MAELKVGDQVFDERGVPCNVVAKSPVWEKRPCYRVVTDDGDEIIADQDHEWLARLCASDRAYRVVDTKRLSRERKKQAVIKRQLPLELPHADLPIDPYVLGVWLGDGCSNHATITQGDNDIAWMRAEIDRLGYVTSDRKTENTFGILNIQVALERLGILGDKHIPDVYLRASKEQRLALLQGLIDTDGHVTPKSDIEFTSVNRRLADQACELVRSLGRKCSIGVGRATLRGKDCGPKYRVRFRMAGAARMPRKAERTKDVEKTPHRYVSALRCEDTDTVCIEVDSPSHMFLCGRSMLPTHNSELISKYFPAWTIGRKPNDDYILASYEADFAAEWGRKVRDILVEHGQRFFGVKLRQDSKAADHWRIENAAGGMQTCGVGGPLTGKGADILAIDDPFKNMEEANSDTIRAKKMDWFRTAAYTRLSPTAAMIMVATRWHEGDITGVVLDEMKDGGDQWTYLHLPALHEGKEVWADLTIPGEHAERIKAHEGMTFKQLNAFFEHCKTAA